MLHSGVGGVAVSCRVVVFTLLGELAWLLLQVHTSAGELPVPCRCSDVLLATSGSSKALMLVAV